MRQRSREGSNINFKSTCAPGSGTRRFPRQHGCLSTCGSVHKAQAFSRYPSLRLRGLRGPGCPAPVRPPSARTPPCSQIKGKLQTEPLLAPQSCGVAEPRSFHSSLPRSTPGCRVDATQHPHLLKFLCLLCSHQDFVSPTLKSPLPWLCTCRARVPGLRKVLSQVLVLSLAFPGPTQATLGAPESYASRGMSTSLVFRARTRSRASRALHKSTPGCPAVPKGRCALHQPRLPWIASSARASRAPRQHAPLGLLGSPARRAAPPRGGGCGPNSAASPCASWPPSSPAFWRSSAAPFPGPCWPTTPWRGEGLRGSGSTRA